MTAWIVADIAVVAIIVAFVYFSMKRGLVKASYKGLARIVSIILVFSLHTSFQGYIEHSFIGDAVRNKVRISIQQAVNENPQINEEQEKAEDITKALQQMKLPGFMTRWIIEENNGIENLKSGLVDGITDAVFPMLINIISILLLYILIRFSLWMLFCSLRLIFEIPILDKFDKGLGMVVGMLNALLIIYIASALIMLFASPEAEEWIGSTKILKYFCENNFIKNLFVK